MARSSRKKSKRVRLSKEEIRKKTSTPSGGGNWLKLPEGVEKWEPEKAGKYTIDVLPYETTSDNHPDDVAAGVIWWKYPFRVHHGLGAESKSIVCPTSIGKPCPVCEEVQRLKKDYDENEDLIKELRGQQYVAMNILHPEDDEKVAIFAMSIGKFFKALEGELAESESDVSNFFDVNEDGRTLKVRWSKASFAGRDYLEATKIDFAERDEMDEDEVFDMVVNLDEMFDVLPYEKLKDMFMQNEGEEDEEDDNDGEEDETPRKRKPSKLKKKTTKKPEPDEDDEEEDEPSSKKSKSRYAEDDDEEEEEPEDGDTPWDEEDETEEETKTRKKKAVKKVTTKKQEPEPDEDDEDDEGWDDDEEEEEKPAPKKSKKKVVKKKATKKPEPEEDEEDGWDDDDENWDDDDDEEEEEKPAPKKRRALKRKK